MEVPVPDIDYGTLMSDAEQPRASGQTQIEAMELPEQEPAFYAPENSNVEQPKAAGQPKPSCNRLILLS